MFHEINYPAILLGTFHCRKPPYVSDDLKGCFYLYLFLMTVVTFDVFLRTMCYVIMLCVFSMNIANSRIQHQFMGYLRTNMQSGAP